MFGFYSNKPGRGVSKEEAKKRNYFDIFGRHFGHIMGANFWYVLTNIIFFAAAIILINVYFSGDNLVHVISYIMTGKMFILPFLPFVPFMAIGPFTAGYTYIIRNYAKQEPTFLIAEFFEHSKRNFKQAIVTSVLSTAVAYALLQAFIFYNNFFVNNGLPIGIFYVLAVLVLVLYVSFMFYVYPIMVTFKMNLKTVYKNAWVFTISKLPQNFLIFVLLAGLNIAVFYAICFVAYLPTIAYLIVLAFFMTGFTAFTANYYIWHVMDKYIVQLVTPKKNPEAVFDDDEYPDFDDEYSDFDEEVLPEDEYLL